MFAFYNRLGARRHLIGMGIVEQNIILLKQKKPIWKPFTDFELPWSGGVAIVHRPHGSPNRTEPLDPKKVILLEFHGDAIDLVRTKILRMSRTIKREDQDQHINLVVFYGRTEEELERDFTDAGLISTETKTIRPQARNRTCSAAPSSVSSDTQTTPSST